MVRRAIATILLFGAPIAPIDASAQMHCAPSIYVACEVEKPSSPQWQWRTNPGPTMLRHVPASASVDRAPVPLEMSTKTKLVLGATAVFGVIGFVAAVGGHDDPNVPGQGWRDELNGAEGFALGAVLPWVFVGIMLIVHGA